MACVHVEKVISLSFPAALSLDSASPIRARPAARSGAFEGAPAKVL